jgi:uncharacterized phage protein (TIGR02218 family)
VRAIPPALQTHLNTGATTLCWAWRITRGDGAKFGFTDHDLDIAFDGTSFKASTGFTASQVKESVGLNVDNLDVDAAFQSEALTEQDLAAGLYDDAQVELWRVNWADTTQLVLIRKGSLGEVKRKEGAFTAELRGWAHYLNQNTGRTYCYTCDAVLGDARCGIDLTAAGLHGSGTVASAVDQHTISVTGLGSFAANLFAGGLLTWTSGANAGAKMEVQRHAPDFTGAAVIIGLWHDMPLAIAPGDTFTITAGCDKMAATCNAKFANIVNFRGFARIPGDDVMLLYPTSTDARLDGSSMFS